MRRGKERRYQTTTIGYDIYEIKSDERERERIKITLDGEEWRDTQIVPETDR